MTAFVSGVGFWAVLCLVVLLVIGLFVVLVNPNTYGAKHSAWAGVILLLAVFVLAAQ